MIIITKWWKIRGINIINFLLHAYNNLRILNLFATKWCDCTYVHNIKREKLYLLFRNIFIVMRMWKKTPDKYYFLPIWNCIREMRIMSTLCLTIYGFYSIFYLFIKKTIVYAHAGRMCSISKSSRRQTTVFFVSYILQAWWLTREIPF